MILPRHHRLLLGGSCCSRARNLCVSRVFGSFLLFIALLLLFLFLFFYIVYSILIFRLGIIVLFCFLAYERIDDQTEALILMIGEHQVDYRFFIGFKLLLNNTNLIRGIIRYALLLRAKVNLQKLFPMIQTMKSLKLKLMMNK